MNTVNVDPADLHMSSLKVSDCAATLDAKLTRATTEDTTAGYLPLSKAAHPGFVDALIASDKNLTRDLEALADALQQAAQSYVAQDEANAEIATIPTTPGTQPGLNL